MIDKTGWGLWLKQNRTTMWSVVQVRSMPKMKLSCHDWSNRLQFVMKTKWDSDVIDRKGVVYAKKWNWAVVTNWIRYDLWWKPNSVTTWPIIEVRFILKTKLSFHDRLDWVWSIIKTRQDNNVKGCNGAIYAKNDIELSWSIESGADCDKNQIGQLHDWSYRCGLC